MQVWIKCPQFHWIEVWMTHRLMHKHVGKCAKIQGRKGNQMGGATQAWQPYKHRTEQGKVCIKHTDTTDVYLTNNYT